MRALPGPCRVGCMLTATGHVATVNPRDPGKFIRTLCLSCAFVALAFTASSAQSPPHPNVVMFIMDDLGYGDVGSYGDPDAKTPNIDRLAREGVKLTDFYAGGGVSAFSGHSWRGCDG